MANKDIFFPKFFQFPLLTGALWGYCKLDEIIPKEILKNAEEKVIEGFIFDRNQKNKLLFKSSNFLVNFPSNFKNVLGVKTGDPSRAQLTLL